MNLRQNIEQASVAWHNPDKVSTVGEGWRFLYPEEVKKFAGRRIMSIEYWDGRWRSATLGFYVNQNQTFRVRLDQTPQLV